MHAVTLTAGTQQVGPFFSITATVVSHPERLAVDAMTESFVSFLKRTVVESECKVALEHSQPGQRTREGANQAFWAPG